LPICPPSHSPPLCTKVFTSDAAGLPKGGQWLGEIGCGIVGTDEKGDTVLAYQLWWNKEMIENHKDGKGSRYGSKTATLEMVGVILPFLLMPEQLVGQHVVCRVDNMACVYGFQNYHMKGDISTSILIKALRMIEACLGNTIHVVHIQGVRIGKVKWQTTCPGKRAPASWKPKLYKDSNTYNLPQTKKLAD
jgi:hypothetical protein